jgi:hypothetical protein
MAGAEQNRVTDRAEGEGVQLVCILAMGGSVSKDFMLTMKYPFSFFSFKLLFSLVQFRPPLPPQKTFEVVPGKLKVFV